MYACDYCGTDHSDITRAKEHIIPESWYNKNYCLPNTCSRWNKFFAESFENKVRKANIVRP